MAILEDYELTEPVLNTFQKMSRQLLKKHLVEGLISKNTLDIVISPLEDMTLEQKLKYASQLTTILKTSKTEGEVLERSRHITVSK